MKKVIDTVLIDSKDKVSGSTSTTDFKINLPYCSSSYNVINIRKVIFPLSMNNITSTTNDWATDATPQSITAGIYDIDSLITAMTAEDPTNYTFTYSNGRITITASGAAFTFDPSGMANILGFTGSSYTGATSYTAEESPALVPTQYFCLESKVFARGIGTRFEHTDRRPNMVMIIPWNTDISNLLVFEPQQPIVTTIKHNSGNDFDFRLTDDSGSTIDIGTKTMQIVIERIKL